MAIYGHAGALPTSTTMKSCSLQYITQALDHVYFTTEILKLQNSFAQHRSYRSHIVLTLISIEQILKAQFFLCASWSYHIDKINNFFPAFTRINLNRKGLEAAWLSLSLKSDWCTEGNCWVGLHYSLCHWPDPDRTSPLQWGCVSICPLYDQDNPLLYLHSCEKINRGKSMHFQKQTVSKALFLLQFYNGKSFTLSGNNGSEVCTYI